MLGVTVLRCMFAAVFGGVLAGCEVESPPIVDGEEPPAVAAPEPEIPEAPPPSTAEGFVTVRTPIRDQGLARWQAFVRERRLAQGYADYLNGWIRIPQPIALTFAECGRDDAFYQPRSRSIVMCYELLQTFDKVFAEFPPEEREQVLLGAIDFIFYHEVGHALIHTLDLPALGREEDAADQLAVFILADGTPEGEQAAIDGAVALYRVEQETDETAFADEHSLGPQRFYNIACWIYGKSPDRFANLLSENGGVLPPDRAERCPAEFARLEDSWNRLLEPNLR